MYVITRENDLLWAHMNVFRTSFFVANVEEMFHRRRVRVERKNEAGFQEVRPKNFHLGKTYIVFSTSRRNATYYGRHLPNVTSNPNVKLSLKHFKCYSFILSAPLLDEDVTPIRVTYLIDANYTDYDLENTDSDDYMMLRDAVIEGVSGKNENLNKTT